MKRKAQRLLNRGDHVVLRDVTDDRYPYLDEDESKMRIDRGRWTVLIFKGIYHDGLRFVWHRHFAYLGDDGEEWDYSEIMDDAAVSQDQNPWRQGEEDWAARRAAMSDWNALPERNRAWLEISGVVPYEAVIDIDEKGDEYGKAPHLYTIAFDAANGPFVGYYRSVRTSDRWSERRANADPEKRVKKFTRKGEPPPERDPTAPHITGDDEAGIAVPEQ